MNKSNGYSFIRWMFVLAVVTLVGTFAAICISTDGHSQTSGPMCYSNTTLHMTSGQLPYITNEEDRNALGIDSLITVADNDGIIFSIDSETGKISPKDVDWGRVCRMSEKVSRSMKAVFRAMSLQANHPCNKKD